MKRYLLLAALLGLTACASGGNFRAVTDEARSMNSDQYKMALLSCNGQASGNALKGGSTAWNLDGAIYQSMNTRQQKDEYIMGCMANAGFVWDKSLPKPDSRNPMPASY